MSVVVKQIVELIEELPSSQQTRLLHQLKMKKAMKIAERLDKKKKPVSFLTDDGIADIIHGIRTRR